MIVAFIDQMRAKGHTVESVCRVLREQGCQIAARTYRVWKRADRPVAARTISDAQVLDIVREVAWTIDHQGRRTLNPEGLYAQREITALVRCRMPEASPGAVDRALRTLDLSGVLRATGCAPPAHDTPHA